MKNSSYHKLLKLCITEALLSVGFQKASTSALQCFTDIIIQTFQGYDIEALTNFMEQSYVEKGESILHKMNVLPKNLVYKARGGGILTDNYDEEVMEDVEDDVVEFTDVDEEEEVVFKEVVFKDVKELKGVDEEVVVAVIYEPWMCDKDYFVMLKGRRIREFHCYKGVHKCQILDNLSVFFTRESDKSCDDEAK